MFPRFNRIPTKIIPKIAFRGQKRLGDGYILRISPDKGNSPPKFAFSISKKVAKNATVRNRIKRRLRAAIKDLMNEGPIMSASYLFIIRSVHLAEKDYQELKQELASTMSNKLRQDN